MVVTNHTLFGCILLALCFVWYVLCCCAVLCCVVLCCVVLCCVVLCCVVLCCVVLCCVVLCCVVLCCVVLCLAWDTPEGPLLSAWHLRLSIFYFNSGAAFVMVCSRDSFVNNQHNQNWQPSWTRVIKWPNLHRVLVNTLNDT